MSDSTQQLFNDWQRQCLSSSPRSEVASLTTKDEARTAFALFAEAGCNLDEKLALLIQELGPAFGASGPVNNNNDDDTASMHSRLAALGCISGALEGVGKNLLSLKIVDLLGTFILQHCAPIRLDEDCDDDIEEQIRDEAIQGLIAVLKGMTLPAANLPDDIETNSGVQAIEICIRIGQTGVEHRCATDDDADDNDDYDRDTRYRAGLSLLPRSRRSRCFDLLHTSVEAIGRISQYLPKEQAAAIEDDIVKFAVFISTCLHGESDPRCLLQLLQLFHTAMAAFQPIFAVLESHFFPISEFYDSIAPYYPIQFTPPPNNIHKITKKMLRNAILAVMSYSAYDDSAERHNKDSMRQLAIGMILEALVPPEEDGPVTLKEQMEALEDFNVCLFPGGVAQVSKLSVTEIKKISDALLIVHDDASRSVAENSNGAEYQQGKDLADLCRLTVSRIALESERYTTNVALWETFVQTPLRVIASALPSSPSQANVAIAYVANLCSCGGPKTLRVGLEVGLSPILSRSLGSNIDALDEDDLCIAVHAVGAFFASARATMEASLSEGITIQPHPLLQYSAEAMDKITALLLNEEQNPHVRIAAIRTFECIVMASPAIHFGPPTIEQISKLIRSISTRLLISEPTLDVEKTAEEEIECLHATAEMLGSFLGISLNNECIKSESTLFQIGALRAFLKDEVFEKILESVGRNGSVKVSQRLDRIVLSKACSRCVDVANLVVSALMKSLRNSLFDIEVSSTILAETLSFLFSQKGSFAAKAFQELASPSVTVFDILEALVPVGNNRPDVDDEVMYKLQLPPKAEDKAQSAALLTKAEAIVSHLRAAYEHIVIEEHFEQLVRFVGSGLPPLSDDDYMRTCVALPLLSMAIRNTSHHNKSSKNSLHETLQAMVSDLAEMAMNSSHASSRTHAAQCLHASIAYFTPQGKECQTRKIVDEVVMVSARTALETSKKSGDRLKLKEMAVRKFSDCLSILALLGSAAATRGASSTAIADHITHFLLDLACNKQATNPFSNDILDEVDLTIFDDSSVCNSGVLSAKAASSFGLLLASATGVPLRNQRFSHTAIKHIAQSVTISDTAASITAIPVGILCTVCHIVCSGTLRNVGIKDISLIVDIVMSGLSSSVLEVDIASGASTTKLVLTSLIKLLSLTPSSFDGKIYDLVTGAMRAFAKQEKLEVVTKLLSLQILDIVARMDPNGNVLKQITPSVVSILGVAMNHPSAVLRHATVEVRNTWFLVA